MGSGIDSEQRRSGAQQPGAVLTDRRRPGRQDHVSPALLPMLRGEMPAYPLDQTFGPARPDQLSAVRGIAFSLLLSSLVIAAVVAPFLLFRH